MGRKPCCNKDVVRRGAWTTEEDKLLRDYIVSHGEGKWRSLPLNAGLNRCGKSCRLRWFNYLKPDIKRGNITLEEEDLIIKLHEQFGNRWVLIAEGLPGRTDNEIKNYWNTTLKRKILKNGSKLEVPKRTKSNIVTPHADPCTDLISEQNTSSSNIWESLLQELELESEEEVQLPLPKLESERNVDEKCMEETSSTTNINDESFASSSNMSKESFDWNFDQEWDNEVNMSHFTSEYDNDHDWENWLESFDVRSFSSFLDEDLWSSVYV